jgi:hypothetical protein
MYNGIISQRGMHSHGGASGKGMVYSLYFIILVLFGNCKFNFHILFINFYLH